VALSSIPAGCPGSTLQRKIERVNDAKASRMSGHETSLRDEPDEAADGKTTIGVE
jgi:hypothetical protein